MGWLDPTTIRVPDPVRALTLAAVLAACLLPPCLQAAGRDFDDCPGNALEDTDSLSLIHI